MQFSTSMRAFMQLVSSVSLLSSSCADGCDFFAFVVEICQEVGEWFVCCKVFCSWHSTWENEDIGIGEAGFCKCCVSEHGDAVGCLDLGGFFDGYGFDVNSGAAEKVLNSYKNIIKHSYKNIIKQGLSAILTDLVLYVNIIQVLF